MENQTPDTPEVPNTVQDLLDLQKQAGEPECNWDPDEFMNFIEESLDDLEPSPTQALRAAKMLVKKLMHFHFDFVENEPQLSKYQRRVWKKDFKNLEKALESLTLVRECT
jgi:hypothetical protein